jgi:hypothetical protein
VTPRDCGPRLARMSPQQVAELALGEPDNDPETGMTCRGCGATCHVPPELDPSVFCHDCTQWALEIVSSSLVQVARMEQMREGTWEPPGGLKRAARTYRRGRR